MAHYAQSKVYESTNEGSKFSLLGCEALKTAQMQQQSQQAPPPHSTSTPPPAPPSSTGGSAAEAPPKQVALAMDKLGEAERIIADIRIGADRVLEALFVAASQPRHGTKPLQLFLKEDACMRRYLQDLRSLGKELEESGVLSESVRSRKDFWGLHMPLVCPDGAMVAYAWKRQLAGQAGASAVDRTRLALKAFTDQKRRFFPHLDYGLETNESASKKRCGSVESTVDPKEESSILKMLPDVLNYPSSNKLRLGSLGTVATEKVAVIEMLVPSTFRVVISLHPAGSTDPDAVAFFAPEESGSYVHARGFSVHHVFRHITDYAATALQYFLGNQVESSLYCLLHWICSYQTLFSRPCSKCSRLLAADKQSAFLLPPVLRPYWQFSLSKILSTISSKDHTSDITPAYHVGCFSEEL
ncbi:hypothetical protein PIB30_054891 [Stylosanthes scabra]|uniref:Mediator of RNA polymerase II transcription subunit 27 n=1 Tax=Stylosanthes scabra TaxID=79078 RepID=A0ABU6QID6_9FABA|nr:hypothetical protein [Stylosanthes scabra]